MVVDARGSMTSGVFGEMMLTSFKAQGGEGIVIDGCIRDFPEVQKLGSGLVAAWRDAEFPYPNRSLPTCGQCADRLRRRIRDAG